MTALLQRSSQSNRIEEYLSYHKAMQDAGDLDPSYPMLRYVCDRFELNIEQRYWLAFLFATCYCAPTVYSIYNRFPDYEYVDFKDMERWWTVEGRSQSIFQSDRAWVRSKNQFVDMIRSYRTWLDGLSQQQKFLSLLTGNPQQTYRNCYQECAQLYQMGRFALFLYLEAVHVVTGYAMEPDGIELKYAESSRNGICYAFGYDNWITQKDRKVSLDDRAYHVLNRDFWNLIAALKQKHPSDRIDVWNVETSLCAFKKYKRGKRWIGYYLDRQGDEIEKMQNRVATGVDWDVLWQFRSESLQHQWLKEVQKPSAKWCDFSRSLT